MKKSILFVASILLSLYSNGEGSWNILTPPDSTKKQEEIIQIPISKNQQLQEEEVFITPAIGAGSMQITGSPIANSLYLENSNYNYSAVNSPEYGVSIDYMVAKYFSFGLGVNYQTISFNSSITPQPTPYNYNYYYYNSDPSSAQFTRWNIGVRNLFYFQSDNSDNVHFYMGARAGLSIWHEADTWANGAYNPQYRSFVNSATPLFSFQLLWGMRYFFTQEIGTQLELGLGTPYYAQAGITIRLNDNPKTYSVTKSQFRAMNENAQMTHKDSANLGLLKPVPEMKK